MEFWGRVAVHRGHRSVLPIPPLLFFLGKAKTEAMYFSSIYLYRNLVASSMLPHSLQLRAAFGMQSEAGVTCPYFKIDKARLCSNNR